MSDQLSMRSAFEWIEAKFGGVEIFINNAGVYKGMAARRELSDFHTRCLFSGSLGVPTMAMT